MNLKPFLDENQFIDFTSPVILEKAGEIFCRCNDKSEKAKIAYEFVRDKIPHSFDINAKIITAKASDVLKYKTGICHAKSNLLAALLRSQNIPSGLCYQHITLLDDDSKGYCLHCYNAIFINNCWIKVDARGNMHGINAQFSVASPVLAFPNRAEYNEYFIEGIYAQPDIATMELLSSAKTLQEVANGLPSIITCKPNII